jgi:hypothetical protein
LGGFQDGCEGPKEGSHRDPPPRYRREGHPDAGGGLLGDLNLKGLDATQMDDLVGVTDEVLGAQMEFLDENEVSDSGEDTVGADL